MKEINITIGLAMLVWVLMIVHMLKFAYRFDILFTMLAYTTGCIGLGFAMSHFIYSKALRKTKR